MKFESKPTLEDFPPFRIGDLVKFKSNLSDIVKKSLGGLVEKGYVYKVCYIVSADDYGPSRVWVGPKDMSEDDVNTFTPTVRSREYKNMLPISAEHLERASFDA